MAYKNVSRLKSNILEEWKKVLEVEAYSKLGNLIFVDGIGISEGLLDIIDKSGILWKTFSVKIEIPKNYPRIPPIIFEVGGDLPKESDWHVNYDSSCCVGPNTKIYRKLDYKIEIKKWLDLVVMPYFFDQVYKIEHGVYKGKEHNHYSIGLLDDYKEWWHLDTNNEVIEKLNWITGTIKFRRNDKCYCGSKLKFKNCHQKLNEFENIPIEIFKKDLKMIDFELQKSKNKKV